MDNKIVIELKDNIYTLTPTPLEQDINIEEYLRIDYHNIFAEIITMPLVLNQIANLRAEMDNAVAHQKMGVEILRANIEKGVKKERQKVSLNDLENCVLTNKKYQDEKALLIEYQKRAAYLDSFYWSAKAKIDALSKISDKIAPEEFSTEMLEGTINRVVIKKFNGKI